MSASSVSIDGKTIGKIGQGLMLLVGVAPEDTAIELAWMSQRCLHLKLFPDENGKPWSKSVQEINGQLLVVSQFTLYGECRKGRRPSFSGSAKPAPAEALYEHFVDLLRASNLSIQTGKFGAMMQVEITNDGLVTLILER